MRSAYSAGRWQAVTGGLGTLIRSGCADPVTVTQTESFQQTISSIY